MSQIVNGGGGGSGTVTNTGGALTANAVVLGAGGADTKVSTGIITNGASELDLGVNATASGVLGLNGSTSGKATFTAPAVAGTVSNPVVSTNWIQTPEILLNNGGAAGGIQFLNANTSISVLSSYLRFINGGASNFSIDLNGSPLTNTAYGLSPTNDTTAADAGVSRTAASVVAIGNATAGDESGLLRSANGGKVTGDITLTVNTAITIFSFSLPAVAKAWGWQAVIPWIISAGSGTNTLSIGVNYTQTPTGTTGMCGEILTSNANAGSEAFVALSATGATNILTSGTITPGAGLFQASCSGTLLASATAGTFTITMTAAGTTATALAKAGATCWFY